MGDGLPVRDALLSFAAGEELRAALFLTYSFDGRWFEEALVPELCERPIATMMIIRDRNAITSEAPSVRYRKANACRTAVFHPKLCLLVGEQRARAVISSANLTRCGFERQRELGRVYDLGPETPDRGLFTAMLEYLRDGVSTEVRGSSARDLGQITTALQEIVSRHGSVSSELSHSLLHNYAQPIWSQLLERVPHRVLRRAVVVSPFFEPDRKRPEDPPLGSQDASIFQRMLLEDFEFDARRGEMPVRVFFRLSEGRTELPVRKLRELRDKISFFAQDERDQRLHAKLLLLEGAEGPGREPFLIALHGSPNFTTAGLLNRPPHGNSELAILTSLPVRRKAFDSSISILGLERGFTEVRDIAALKSEKGGEPPAAPSQGVADATLLVAEGKLQIALLQAPPEGAQVRVLLLRDGAWVAVGSADATQSSEVIVPVVGLAEMDERTKLLELRGATVRVEIIGSDGTVLASDVAPINVDIPQEFCGLALVGTALLTLDERIARAGVGLPLTCREQQKWLEARRSEDTVAPGPSVTAHQADLDRFYRNIHQGLRGILARCKGSPGSEFSMRRSLDELTRWSVEAATTDTVPTRECRLFLVDRLLRAVRAVIDGASAPLRSRFPAIGADIPIGERVSEVAGWLEGVQDATLTEYVAESRGCAKEILGVFATGER